MKTPKNHINTKLLLAFLLLAIFSCDNREWDNPFDPDCPKELFTPSDFKAVQEGTEVKLTWNQTNTKISGFLVEESMDGIVWTIAATPGKNETTWNDNSIQAGKKHHYRIVAKAGQNSSNERTVEVTPVFASSLTTKPLTKLLSISAILGGEITSDGGSPVTARGVCWNTSPNPTISNSKTTDGNGTGTFTSTITGLSTATTYYARAYATTSVGTSYGNEISFKTFFGEVADIEGNVYPTVKIGTQIWMAENLKVTKYNDGTAIPNVTDNTAWAGLTTGAYCWYNNDATANKATCGALYNWYALNTNKLAPVGWHVATDAEWTTLENYLVANGFSYDGTTTGNNIAKSLAATTSWNISSKQGAVGKPDYSANRNITGFTALAGGTRNNEGLYLHINDYGYWWITNDIASEIAWYRGMFYNYDYVFSNTLNKHFGSSVRCILGEPTNTSAAAPRLQQMQLQTYIQHQQL